jgi:hypothetical protein
LLLKKSNCSITVIVLAKLIHGSASHTKKGVSEAETRIMSVLIFQCVSCDSVICVHYPSSFGMR